GILRVLLDLYSRPGQPAIDVSLDLRAAAFASLVMLVVTIFGGVVPAIRAQESRTESALRRIAASRAGGGFFERRIRGWLVVAQVALAVTLFCASGVFLTSLRHLLQSQPGFSPDKVWTGQLRLSPLRYPDVARRARFVRDALARISAIPGVISAGTTQTTFLP